jgi:hypothetical protein
MTDAGIVLLSGDEPQGSVTLTAVAAAAYPDGSQAHPRRRPCLLATAPQSNDFTRPGIASVL